MMENGAKVDEVIAGKLPAAMGVCQREVSELQQGLAGEPSCSAHP